MIITALDIKNKTVTHDLLGITGLNDGKEVVLPPRTGFDLAPGLFLQIVQEETFRNVPKMPYHDGLRCVVSGVKITKAVERIRSFSHRTGVRAQLRRLLDWHGPGSLVAMLQDVMEGAGFARVSTKLGPAFQAGCSEEEILEDEGKFSW